MKALADQTHYEVLEIAPGATADEVERAYARSKEAYAPGSLATYALTEPGEAEEVLRRVEEAFAVLSSVERRRVYDTEHGFGATPESPSPTPSEPAAQPPEVSAPPVAAAAPLASPPSERAADRPVAEAAAPKADSKVDPGPGATASVEATPDKPVRKTETDLAPDEPVSGEALRRVREAHGWTLKDLENRTKIGKWHLENIEREKYGDLLAHVYLRGFLMSVARELKLDPVRVAKSYLEQMKAKLAAKAE